MDSKDRKQRTQINKSLLAFIVLTPMAWGVLGQMQGTYALAATGSGATANYGKALYYEQNQNYYNAVYYASQALAAGDAKAQTTLDETANALLKQAESEYQSGNITTAMNSFSLLAHSKDAPSADQTKSQQYLTASEDYGISVWYQTKKNYVNAFIYAERSAQKGDPRAASRVKSLAAQVESEAQTKLASGDEQGAKMRLQLLANSTQVSSTVKQKAKTYLTQLNNYAIAKWYQSNGNPFNAVYYLNQAGANDPQVTSLMTTVATTLETNADQAMKNGQTQQAIASYQILSKSNLVNQTIKQEVTAKLQGHKEYAEAVWYKQHGNLFNAIYYASEASQDHDVLAGGYLATEAVALLNQAKTNKQNGNTKQADAALQLLATTPGIPSTTRNQAKSILYPPAPVLTSGLSFTVDSSNHADTIVHLGAPSQMGDTYVYKVSSNSSPVPRPNVGDLTSGWLPVANGDSLKVADGTNVGVAEVDAGGKVVQFSNATAQTYIQGDPTTTTITASPSSVTTSGSVSQTITITVQVKGSSGQNRHLGGDNITLSYYDTLDPSPQSQQINRVTDNKDGTYTATIYTDTLSGTKNASNTATFKIQGTLNGQHITHTATFDITYSGSSSGGSSGVIALPF